MKLKHFILPTGIILALTISLIYPVLGIFLKQLGGIEISVIAIFLTYGYIHNINEFKCSHGFIKGFVIVCITSLLLAPLLGLGTSYFLLSPIAGIGLIVMSSMPPTLSSGVVITETAKGNTILALSLTVILNLLALFTVPLTLSILLFGINIARISPIALFLKLFLLVFIPFLLGTLTKKVSTEFQKNNIIRLIPTFCIILAIWICMSTSSQSLKEVNINTLFFIIISVVLVHIALLLLNFFLGSIAKASMYDKKAIMFLGSQKTLPLAAFILTTLPEISAIALITCITFHFCQLLIDSIIASLMSSSKCKSKKPVV